MTDTTPITQILSRLNDGDDSAVERLLPLVYDELRALAGSYFARQPRDHTLQPTALVHEAYLKLVRHDDPNWTGRAHFLGVAAKAMRHILIDHARGRQRDKRGGDWRRMTLDDDVGLPGRNDLDILAIDDALNKLAELSERRARVVELRFFGGLTIADAARVLDVASSTVDEDWHLARAWLARELGPEDPP